MVGLVQPSKYGEYFHELYTNSSERKLQETKGGAKRNNNKDKKAAENLVDNEQLFPAYSLAHIELKPNSSKFTVFSAIRSAVLEADAKYAIFQEKSSSSKKIKALSSCCLICTNACLANNLIECSCHSNEKRNAGGADSVHSDGDTETDEAVEKEVQIAKVPLIVGAGLRSLFELIGDARNIQPSICTKALKALFDVIQGQHPESFKLEPDDLINPLYDLLLDLATMSTSSAGQQASHSPMYEANWSNIACSSLIGLCIARGDTGKILKAIAALLKSPKQLSAQIIKLPLVLFSLQRTVMSAALNKPIRPDFHSHGIPHNCLVDEFSLRSILSTTTPLTSVQPAMASDGTFIYLLYRTCLLKIGTGFNGSFKGHVYATNTEFGREASGWLGFCAGKLYFKRFSKRLSENILLVNTDTLSTVQCPSNVNLPMIREGLNYVLFSDEESINMICTNRDDTLVVKQIFNSSGILAFDLPLKLARKKFRTLGYAAFEDEVLNQNQIQKIQSSYNIFEPKLPSDIEIQGIACGKEFGLVKASNGKVYFYGKSPSLGLKAVGRTPTMKITELIISKVSNITQVAVGHDGIHALLVNDDGTVYFAGTARRGEDGDSSKNRRQPKASKPKRLTRIDGHVVIQAACNNGTSAFVTKTGRLIMFGKDTAHCDAHGYVTEFADQHITKVALGKAHCVVLNSKGQLFTFGLNNKGQCGRSCSSKPKESNYSMDTNVGSQVESADVKLNEQRQRYDVANVCDFDDHSLGKGMCRVCVVCKECTAYNVSCVSLVNVPIEERVPGAVCPCGHGDAGCTKCRLCSSCITIQEKDNSDLKLLSEMSRQRSKSNLLRRKDKQPREENNMASDAEKDPPRVAPLAPQHLVLPSNSPVVQIACGLHHTVVLTLTGEVFTFGSNQYGQLGTGDLQAVSGPVQVKVQGAVSQIAAGSNHTVLLTHKGVVYTFGNYQKGQLGRLPNDFNKSSMHDEALKLLDPSKEGSAASAIMAQRQKFLWNCTPGAVFGLGPSFGKKATWIGSSGDQTFIKIDESLITTHILPKISVIADKKTILLIPTIPLSFHALTINRRDGSCTAHYNNQVNFVQIIQSNRNAELPEINQNIDRNIDQMSRSMHESRNQVFEVHENQIHMGAGDQRKRRRQEAKSPIEKPMPQIAFALDPQFNVLWVFDGGVTKSVLCYNVLASEIPKNGTNSSNYRAILSPELSLPTNKPESQVSRSQASLNLLACLDVLTSAQDLIPSCFEDVTPALQNQIKENQSNDYQILNRFENFGGGWGYSGHSVEAIRFSCDTDVLICGFGMYGGRGEYSCKLKVFDLGIDGGGYEKDGTLISETKEIPFECPARSKYHIMLPKPITASAGRWYLIWARIAGPSSDCGSAGQASITTEDQLVFVFKNSKKANNGTDINSGQIPSILYRLITQESKQPTPHIETDPVHKISKSFANTVTKECFESLVALLKWSWESFKRNIREQRDKTRHLQVKQSLEYLIYVNKSCLRLLRKYTNEIYPQKSVKISAKKLAEGNLANKAGKSGTNTQKQYLANELPTPTSRKANMENVQLAECIGNVRALLIEILNDDIFKDICSEDGYRMVLEILEECHTSFVACFDAFYPTSSLKWNCLCDLLSQMDLGDLHSHLLSAIIAGLCSPSIKLRTTFSLLTSGNERQSIVSPSDNFGLPMLSSSENHQYPILVEQMIYRTQQEKTEFASNTWAFKDVLLRLLEIISSPVRAKIENIYNHSVNVNDFVMCKDINQGLINNCCHLLARVLAEIVYQTSLNEFEKAFLPPRSLHSTGNRFSRCDVSRTWNTGNFGPDAIAFTVDRPGIAVAGATMYSGSGSYDYQLELLYDNTVDLQATGHKWETLESVSGSYDQEAVHHEMAEIKFERPVHIKENTRYALRLCSQGARTCSGDSGMSSIRGPCGTTFTFYSCDLSFNGTTPSRGQIPSILYYSNPIKNDGNSLTYANQVTARDTALQVATDITKKCTELLILARNALAASLSPSDNSSNHTQTIDSEHNITPIEEHMDINWANNSRTSALSTDPSLTTARDITKRIESFSKGLIETFKFDKRSTNPFDIEIEIGATEIHPKDLIEESGAIQELNYRKGHVDTKLNGNDRTDNELDVIEKRSDSDDGVLGSQMTVVQLLEVFNTSSANVFHTLLPLIYAQIGTLACNDPKSSVQILGLIKEILPHVAALNQLYSSKEYLTLKSKDKKVDFSASEINKKRMDEIDKSMDICTTSNHYCIVESEHPYRSGSITCQRVEFPPCVQWFAIEFDPQCGTAQLEDYLLISIPSKPYLAEACQVDNDYLDMLDNNMSMQRSSCKNAVVTNYNRGGLGANANSNANDNDWVVIKKFNTVSNWPQNIIILPGNRVEFSLETASLYAQDPHSNRYGFKCLVVGYDNPTTVNAKNSCLIRLEHELAYLGGMCSANLMKKDLNLPDDKGVEDLSTIEDTLTNHHALLSKGFALSESILTVNQALESYLPIGSQSNERQFLKDFISGAPGSSGARLATWLQPESRLDPNKCELSTIDEALRYGWPTQITVKIKDQYGDAVLVPELKVEIKAIPSGSGTTNGNIKMRRVSCTDTTSFGGMQPPPRLNYEPTIKEKMCFKAITFMKPYNNYSFEELRFCSPIQTRITETLYAQDMEDGTFSVHWTPNSVGSYCLTVAIDGILLEEVYRVEVKEGGMPPPSHKHALKKPQPPNKLRKFIAKNSAGLRIRSHPTLQSEQVGIIKLNGVISFIDEIENDDGIWLRLSTESIRQHCNIGWYPTEAWCLQFNQHLGKTLLYPVTEQTTQTNAASSVPKSNSKPKHKSLLENIGSPLAIPPDTPSKPKSASHSNKSFDFSQPRFTPPKNSMVDNILSSTNPFALSFMSSASERSDEMGSDSDQPAKVFESQVSTSSNDSHNQQDESMATSHSSSPSNIGSAIAGVVGGGASKLQALQKWFKGDSIDGRDPQRKRSECGDIAPMTARDLIRAIGVQEPRGNGNTNSAIPSSRSSSPLQIPKSLDSPSRNLSKSAETSNHSEFPDKSASPSSAFVEDKQNGEFEEPSVDTSVNASDVENTTLTNNVLPTPTHVARRGPKRELQDLRTNSNIPNLDIKVAEQMGLLNDSDDNLFSAKLSTAGTDPPSPPLWPPTLSQESLTSSQKLDLKSKARETVTMCPLKRAMPPSLAESLRAVFAAFLWHEGIVHDAMACASFLKFHPSLPKEGATVITRRESGENKITLSREQKAQQRHSVEVANAGNYLNIRPSTLEALTKCGNSCLNNRKYRKNMGEGNENSEKVKLHSLPEIVTVLPPALRCLVYLWEQVCRNCIQIVQSNTLERQKSSSSPTRDSLSGSGKEKVEVAEKEDKKLKKKKKDEGYWCELCEIFLPIPVTYHMRTIHPGCGKSAKGKGYNSVGMFCEGWAGNCGEGGKGASSWFLMCDACREKYVSSNKNINNINNSPNAVHLPEMNIFGVKTTTLLANSEIYTTMKENAIFLLELSTNNTNIPPTAASKRSPQQMPVVAEHQLNTLSDLNLKPSTSRGDSTPNFNFNRHSRVGLRITGKIFGQSTPNRKSYTGCISPDFIWMAPETFACLESLGATVGDDLPYEIFGANAADCYERPLSEISFESCDPNNFDAMTASGTAHGSGTLSKFHRSLSMGQGWSNQQSFNIRTVVNNIVDEGQQQKVVFRRRNNSTNQGEGSLLICYPSENLRKLVPDNLLNSSIASQNSAATSERLNVEPTGEQVAQNKLNNANSFQCNDSKLETSGSKDYFFGSTYEQPPSSDHASVMEIVDANVNGLINRPAIAFITQKHDLDKLRYAMKRSLRIATCRIYSLQALNWLIRSVTQSVCLHDLMWWFVASLSPTIESSEIAKLEDGEFSLEHPVSFTQISGGFCQIITQSLHVFLQSVADLTLYLPAGSPLQRIAIQSFGIKFRQTDHQFLHSSHVFGNISKILSKSDEQNEAMGLSSMTMGESNIHDGMGDHNFARGSGAKSLNYTDLNGMFEITVSSRQAMAESLTDNSTETFWESDEEDRNKCKIIEVSMSKLNYTCKTILVHIDNSRDIQNKVSNVVFYAGQSLGDTTLIKSVDIDSKACAWTSVKITDETCTHFRLEFRGPESTLRVRQIKLLGLPNNLDELTHVAAKANLKLTNATRIQQQICESETLRVFRLITAQVFGKLISTGENNRKHSTLESSSVNSLLADSLDLREHMVGILFSRSKLSHLQKQVIVHIVHAIKKEAQRAKEEWEIANVANTTAFKEAHTSLADHKSESSTSERERFRAPDTYCFEMLSMVLALSGSAVGRSYLSHQHGLLKDLLSLLHTGSDRVQRQVTALLRRILPEISPEVFSDLLCVQKMPPFDFNIVHQNPEDFDMNRLGILDIFLAVIAKSLQLQVKIKTNSSTSKGNVEKNPSFVRLFQSVDLSVHQLRTVNVKPTTKENEDDIRDLCMSPFGTGAKTSSDYPDMVTSKKKPKDVTKNINQRWFLKSGVISMKQAESIINLIKDMASGKLSDKWSRVTKAAIAESVLNLTRLEEIFRNPENCIKTATLWLALASLCVLDKEHVEKLSSGQWSKVSDSRPMCTNHDDGETAAIIQCETCGSLCGDCDRFLHLNRKTRNHKRTVCKEEEEAIRVELHESCGRTKLFWLLALADSKTLKGMVEFRDGSHTIISGPQETVGRCRFCGVTGNSGLLEIGNVCSDVQCQEYNANSCLKTKPCGHMCGGVANEKKCLPCLQHVCHAKENEMAAELKKPKLTQDADDMCMICFIEALSCAPSVHLECGHVFHYHCCKMVLEKRWIGPRITFGFSLCPICKADIQHELLAENLEPINSLKEDVKRKALMRIKYEGIVKATDDKDLTNLAMDRYAYYVCFKCNKAYYGGEARCDAEGGEMFNPEELVCGACSDVARAQMCPKHGTDFLEYKCRYCCSVAVFFCFGTTHFCDTCHDDFQRLTNIPKNKLPQCPAGPKAKQLMGDECPLHVIHPPTGEEFALGCGICRNAQTF
ncbi:E3 ubiquitin-protein ligase highwire isoform X3 [Eupeodes corollae]|uniref:E3 ubiquitin-protein ligase highwire isoform X3 n=1 Tax=Eupeodes corollae TaxID=290404 RepID=UPI00249275EB|nr:E3 ubiquitin-protein ligase highwire isoform X3 [Eupeodes corollae]